MNFPKLQNSTTTQFPPNFTKPLKFHKKPTIPKQALTEISKIWTLGEKTTEGLHYFLSRLGRRALPWENPTRLTRQEQSRRFGTSGRSSQYQNPKNPNPNLTLFLIETRRIPRLGSGQFRKLEKSEIENGEREKMKMAVWNFWGRECGFLGWGIFSFRDKTL